MVAFLHAIGSLEVPAAAVPPLLVCTALGTLPATQLAVRLSSRLGSGVVVVGGLLVLAAGAGVLGSVQVVGWRGSPTSSWAWARGAGPCCPRRTASASRPVR
ncbi:hypothetical protein GCM10023108_52490 [Saccharopolyspora hordei]